MAINQQSITEDRASGAVVLDSSLSFWNDGKGQYLTFTPSTNGNRKTWTISMWFQDIQPDLNTALIGDDGGSPNCYCYLMNNHVLRFAAADGSGGDAFTVDTTRLFRDVCGWYHLTLVVDTTESTDTDRIKVYINGESVDLTSTTYPDQYEVIGGWNSASSPMRIGQFSGGSYFEGQMSDVYSLDGYALGPENFGYTDALTNTWRPKKYEGAFNAPIDGWDVTTWSSYVSGSVDGSYPLSNCFTAPIGSGYANGTRSVNPGSLTFDISALNLTVTNVRLNVYIYGSPTLTVNGTAVPITGTDNQEFVVAVDGQLNSIVWSYNSVTVYCYMRGIEVDLGDGAGYRLFADASGAPAGVNGFHLPFDGSAPIGVDQSGNGNDFTPVNLTSSATLDKATGALPILNTSSGGNVAVPGVRGQAGIAVTVYNPTGSQNRFYFDGVEAPSYNFARGQTVTFDTSDSTVATHPFRLSGVSDGAHAADYYSVDFDGTGDYLSIAESTDWLFEEGDFTVEFWAYIDNIATDGGIVTNMDNFNSSSQYNSRWVIGLYSSELRVWLADDGAHVLHDYFPPQGEWVHYAVTRETGNKFTLYRNGTNIFTATQTCDLDTNGALQVGYLNGLGTYDGKIADLRLVKGTAVYTTNFQPPVTSLTNITNTKVLCCNSSTVTGSTVTPTTITANGDPTSSNDNPYDTYPFSTVTDISEGTVGAATTITFPYNSPDTLYYHCSSHSGMGGSVGLTTDIQTADPYASKNVLAVAFDGGSNDYSNLINTGSTKKSITENTSSGETMEYRNFYLSSYKFDGSNDVVYAADSTEFTMGGGDWTIECWIRRRRVDTDEWFLVQGDGTGANTPFGLHIDPSTNYLEGRARSDSSGQIDFAGTTPMQTGLWYHCALVRDGSTLRLFLNGTQENTNAIAGTLVDSTGPLCMGALTDAGSAATSCYMQDARVYQGIAKYTTSFIPASTWNNICPDSPSGTSYGSELTTPTKGSVSFDNDSDSLNVADNADFDLGTNDFTIECFALLYTIGQFNNIFAVGTDSSDGYRVDISTGNKLRLLAYIGGSWSTIITGGTDLYQKKWFHLAVTRSGSSFDLWVDGVRDATTVTNSDSITNPSTKLEIGRLTTNSLDRNYHGLISNLRFVNGTALYKQTFTPSNKPLTTTSQGATSSEVKLLCCQSQNSATSAAASPDGAVVGYSGYLSGGLVPGSANQYVPSNCFDGDITTTHVRHKTTPGKEGRVGWHFNPPGGIAYSSLEIHSGVSGVGSQEYILNGGSATAFAENTWVEIDSSSGTLTSLQITEGSTGNSNIYLGAIRINGSTILTDTLYNEGTGAVISDSQPSEFNPFDTNIDMVMGKSGNYATLNPLYKNSNVSLTDGNLSMSISSLGHYSSIATLGMTTGKYYWEVDSGTGWTNDPAWGIVGEESEHYDDQVNSVPGAFVRDNGRRYYDGTEGDVWMEVDAMAADEGSTLGLAYDGIAGTLQVWINGRYQGVAFTGLKNGMTRNLGSVTSNRWYPCLKMYDGGPIHINFGQQPFKYPCPYGFGPLCSGNLEKPQFVRSNGAVGVSTWWGTSADNHFIPSGHQADLLWTKDRDTSSNWYCFDSVRGRTQVLHPNLTNAESGPENNIIRSLTNTNGYVLGQAGDANNSSYEYVGYSWKAGGNAGTFNKDGVDAGSAAAAGVSDGSITPTACSVGTAEGFSILKYTGTGVANTIGHGLNAEPKFIICKQTSGTEPWAIYHYGMGNDQRMALNSSDAKTSTSTWNSTTPTSSVFSVGVANLSNESSETYIAYCWCNKPGLQRFGKYTGNGSSDGPYVELGFKPAMVIVKNIDEANSWRMWNSKIPGYNVTKNYLSPDGTSAEGTVNLELDILSNGFKQRGTNDSANKNDNEYVYMAWAESPYHNLYGGQPRAM